MAERRIDELLRRAKLEKMGKELIPAARQMGAVSIGTRLAAMSPDQRRGVIQRRVDRVGEQQARQEFGVLAQAASRAGSSAGGMNTTLRQAAAVVPRSVGPAPASDPAYGAVLAASGATHPEDRYSRGALRGGCW